MKKKIEIEVDIPENINPEFLKYMARLDNESMSHIIGFVGGVLYSSGKISEKELMDYTEKFAK